MNDSILNRIPSRSDDQSSRRGEETELLDDFQSFGWLRGIRDRALMLELRLRSGNIISLGYPWLERAEFDPSEGIVLQFGGREVRIVGRNLNSEQRSNVRLFAGIIRHRVLWIQESDDSSNLGSDKGAVVIEQIRV